MSTRIDVFGAAVLMMMMMMVMMSSVPVESLPSRRTTVPTTIPPWMVTTIPPWMVTTIPPGCRTEGGQLIHPGMETQINHVGGCQVCTCSYRGHLSCYYADCLVPMCVDAQRPHGACCATCPNGTNCRIPATGEVIAAPYPVERAGMSCECPPQSYRLPGVQEEDDYTAICTPHTTIPPTTTIPPSDGIPVGRRSVIN
ncbi:uncharacterized protein LOC143298662 [Babylonia areolata]|uniref:uncharacterized protein LOC143298662 n=1 Tax=Babylonia areolata TaxID=304850 RepID=UPI003FD21D89